MKPQTLIYIVVILIAGCASSVFRTERQGNAAQGIQNRTPTAAFSRYWDYAKSGNSEMLTWITTDAPPKFLTCLSRTPEECTTEVNAEKERANHSAANSAPNRFELKIDYDFSMIREHIPASIRKTDWKSYAVDKETILENEAKLLITVISDGRAEKKDVLLYKVDDDWKIFEISDAGLYESWAMVKNV